MSGRLLNTAGVPAYAMKGCCAVGAGTTTEHLLAYGEPTPDAALLAAAYAFGIARNHPFIDGNKRTALIAARTFLLINGFDLDTSQEEKYFTFLQLAKGEIEEISLAGWIRQHLKEG